ncbi:unnamed protein product [Calicophoron daubneyi]|uniref:Uncharacterized protein n=1 Tax=Calicophoron daubneyi TaxID=300641 RepID=A0AAV2TQB5_CALDB
MYIQPNRLSIEHDHHTSGDIERRINVNAIILIRDGVDFDYCPNMTAVTLRCTSILPHGKVNCSSMVDRRREHRHVIAKMSGEIPADWNALNVAEKLEKRLHSSVFKRITTSEQHFLLLFKSLDDLTPFKVEPTRKLRASEKMLTKAINPVKCVEAQVEEYWYNADYHLSVSSPTLKPIDAASQTLCFQKGTESLMRVQSISGMIISAVGLCMNGLAN